MLRPGHQFLISRRPVQLAAWCVLGTSCLVPRSPSKCGGELEVTRELTEVPQTPVGDLHFGHVAKLVRHESWTRSTGNNGRVIDIVGRGCDLVWVTRNIPDPWNNSPGDVIGLEQFGRLRQPALLRCPLHFDVAINQPTGWSVENVRLKVPVAANAISEWSAQLRVFGRLILLCDSGGDHFARRTTRQAGSWATFCSIDSFMAGRLACELFRRCEILMVCFWRCGRRGAYGTSRI